jgi:hypothetical protein
LTLQNLTLQGGDAFGSGVSAEGGGIDNQGTLVLNGVTIQNNVAQGSSGFSWPHGSNGASAAGGGIYSTGILTLEGGTVIQGNKALGGSGWPEGYRIPVGNGGNGSGGGLYIGGGTVTLESSTVVQGNQVVGGAGGQGLGAHPSYSTKDSGGNGGNGCGGGLYVAGGTVTLESGTLVQSNVAVGASGGFALGGHGGNGGNGFGGGLYVAGGTVTLTSTTLSSNNTQGGVGGGATGRTIDYRWAQGTPGAGGSGYGGGLYATAGTISLVGDTVDSNSAGQGGGLDITNSAKVSLDAVTLAHTTSNSGGDIYGSYTLI